jgi:hypothetical protein
MSKFDDAMTLYREQLGLAMGEFDDARLTRVAKNLGPAIYLGDASKVSCSDKAEKDRIRDRYLIGRLGLEQSNELDEVVAAVCTTLGDDNRNKYRAVFYYLLTEKLDMWHKVMN